MNSTIESLDDNKVKLSVEVSADEFEEAVEAAFKKIAKEVRLPGFRPGKAPRKVLEARFGTTFARGEALQEAIPEYYVAAVREHDVDVIAAPDIDITAGQEEGPVSFDAVVEVRPHVIIAGYDGIRVEVPNPEPTDDEVTEQLDALRGRFAGLESADRPATDGDQVKIDIAGSYDGEAIDNLTADDYVYEVGSGGVVAEVDDNLRGAKVGDILEFDAEHPGEDDDGRLEFRVLVKDVQEKVLPELDDEFVQEASEFETVAELRDDLLTQMGEMKRNQAAATLRDNIADSLADLVDDEPPQALVDAEVQRRVQDMAMRLQQQGASLEQYLQVTQQSGEEMVDQMREPAARAVLVDLALRCVADAESIDVDDDELQAELDHMALHIGGTGEELHAQLEAAGTLRDVRVDVVKRQALEWLVDHAEIVDDEGNVLSAEAFALPEHDHDHDDAEGADDDHDEATDDAAAQAADEAEAADEVGDEADGDNP